MNSGHGLKSRQNSLTLEIYGLLIVLVLIAALGLLLQKSSHSNLYSKGFHDYQQSTKLLRDIYQVQANIYTIQSMVASGQDKNEIAKRSNETTSLLEQDVAMVKRILTSDINDEQKKFYNAVMTNILDYQQQVGRVIKLIPMGTGAAYLYAAEEKKEAVARLLAQLMDLESNQAASTYTSANRNFYIIIFALLILLGAGVVVSSFFIKKTFSALTEPISEASSVLREYADGKYARGLAWEGDGEMGDLAASVNALKNKLGSGSVPAAKAAQASAVPATAPAAPAAAPAEAPKSLSGMVKKEPEKGKEGDKLVISPKKAIDKLQDI